MTKFVDTYALIAWLNCNDAAHTDVRSYLEAFQGRLVTTEWVLMEVADALASVRNRAVVAEFLQTVRSDPLYEVIDYERWAYKRGFDLFRARSDKDWSLTDCISFVVMKERHLMEALTADKHFQQAGYQAVFAKEQ